MKEVESLKVLKGPNNIGGTQDVDENPERSKERGKKEKVAKKRVEKGGG